MYEVIVNVAFSQSPKIHGGGAKSERKSFVMPFMMTDINYQLGHVVHIAPDLDAIGTEKAYVLAIEHFMYTSRFKRLEILKKFPDDEEGYVKFIDYLTNIAGVKTVEERQKEILAEMAERKAKAEAAEAADDATPGTSDDQSGENVDESPDVEETQEETVAEST